MCREEREKIIDSLEKNSDNGDNDGDVGDVGDNNDGITDEEEENKYKWNTLKHDVDEYEEMNGMIYDSFLFFGLYYIVCFFHEFLVRFFNYY